MKNEKIGELVIVDGESYCRRWSFNDAPFLNSSRDFSTIPDTRTKPGVYLVYDSSDILVRIGSCHTLRENSRSKNGDINKNSWGVLGRLVDDLASTQSCLLKFIMVLLEDTPEEAKLRAQGITKVLTLWESKHQRARQEVIHGGFYYSYLSTSWEQAGAVERKLQRWLQPACNPLPKRRGESFL